MTCLLSLLIHIEHVAAERLEGLCDFLPRRIQHAFAGDLSGQLYVIPKGPLPWLHHAWPRDWVWYEVPMWPYDAPSAVLTVATFGKTGLVLRPPVFRHATLYLGYPHFVLEWYLIPEETTTETTLYSIARDVKARQLRSLLTQCGLKVVETWPVRFPLRAFSERHILTASLLTLMMNLPLSLSGSLLERLKEKPYSARLSWLCFPRGKDAKSVKGFDPWDFEDSKTENP